MTPCHQVTPGHRVACLCFDPRDPAQSIQDRATWKPSHNAILIASTVLLAIDGYEHPINWDKVAALADLCEDVSNDAPRTLSASNAPVDRLATLDETNALVRAIFAKATRPGRRPTTAP